MRFDPSIDRPLSKAYPDIAVRSALADNDKLTRFAIYMIAPDSPFANERDFDFRKKLCVEKMGELDDVEKNSPLWQFVVFELFRLYDNSRYEQWYSMKSSFHILTAKLRDFFSLKDGDRLKISKEIDAIRKEVERIEYDLFEDAHLKEIIKRQATQDSLAGFAEMFAQNTEE